MIALPEYLEQSFLQIAESEHKPVIKLIEQALIEFLEDYQDAKLAEQAMKRIESGESELLDWQDVKAGLYDVAN
jgi:predicted DNA-binding protein